MDQDSPVTLAESCWKSSEKVQLSRGRAKKAGSAKL